MSSELLNPNVWTVAFWKRRKRYIFVHNRLQDVLH